VQRQHLLLRLTLDLNETHRRSTDGFADCFRITRVVLVRLHVGADVTGAHQPDLVPEPDYLPRPIVRTLTRFDSHKTRSELRHEQQHLVAAKLTLDYCPAITVDTVNPKHILAQIDAQRLNFHFQTLPPNSSLMAYYHPSLTRSSFEKSGLGPSHHSKVGRFTVSKSYVAAGASQVEKSLERASPVLSQIATPPNRPAERPNSR
jgi:hypothetical protein